MPETPYSTVIERGYTPINDGIIDWLKPRIIAPYLDIGCNTGWLLSEVSGGTGVDNSPVMVEKATEKGLRVRIGDAACLPFNDGEFATAVLSCVLVQCPDPMAVIREAMRVAKRVIGITNTPGKSIWGHPGSTPWVKSATSPEELHRLGFKTEYLFGDQVLYYFER